MTQLTNQLKEWLASSLTIPVFLILTCFVVFGVFFAGLGYFQDDWHHIYYAYHEGFDGLYRFLLKDSRPLGAYVYNTYFTVLGFSPNNWHWLLMILRTLTVLFFWLALRKIWPQHKLLAGWAALLFAVYPAYPLQALSAAYSLHWTFFMVFMLSLWLMFKAIEQVKWFSWWTFAAIAFQFTHMLVIEYFVGVELLRPALLWLSFRNLPQRERLRQAFQKWLPYLPALGLYAIYRLVFKSIFGSDRFSNNLAENFILSPVNWMTNFLQFAAQDFIFVIISPWAKIVDPSLVDFSRVSSMLMIAVGVILGLACYLVFTCRKSDAVYRVSALKNLLGVGLMGIAVGLLPSWVIGFSAYERNPLWSGRLALPAMPGASLFWAGVVFLFVRNARYRNLVFSLLIGIAVIFHFNTALAFRASSEKQNLFYWQLYWRAPALLRNTILVADNEILPYMGYYPTAYAINLIYPRTVAPPNADYWFNAGSEHIDWETFSQGIPVTLKRYSTTFTAAKGDVVAITFEPSLQQCLWVLRPAYKDIRYLTFEAYRWMSVSSIERIQNIESPPPPQAIFGNEPPRTWCYYYLKADLAATTGDWQSAIQLWQEAQAQNLHPANGVELLPFIESFARADNWRQAQKLSNNANNLPPRMPSLLCSLWETLEQEEAPSPEEQTNIREAKAKLKCQTP